MKNKLLLLAVVVIVGALLYYCFNIGSKSEDVSAAAGETYKLEYTPTLQAYGFTEPVILKAKPQRVVSLVHTHCMRWVLSRLLCPRRRCWNGLQIW